MRIDDVAGTIVAVLKMLGLAVAVLLGIGLVVEAVANSGDGGGGGGGGREACIDAWIAEANEMGRAPDWKCPGD